MIGKFDSRSFASAETIPTKVVVNRELWESCVQKGKVIPIHLQLNPTNKCSFDCHFCSCAKRDKSLELEWASLEKFLRVFKQLGGQSVTLTGGGEPLLYSRIKDLLDLHYELGLSVGLVSNGSAWSTLKPKSILNGAIWCRVSASDELPHQLSRLGLSVSEWLQNLNAQVQSCPKVDWAFSYVLGSTPNKPLLTELIKYAYSNGFTHVRVVNDILRAEQLAESMADVKAYMKSQGIADDIVNWQSRSNWSTGQKQCWIALAKPVLGADGNLYACCSGQYSVVGSEGDYPKELCLGGMDDLPQIIASQTPIDGSVCSKCYYKPYNDLLDAMRTVNTIKHREFI